MTSLLLPLLAATPLLQDGVHFEREVFPLLEEHCFRCHGAGPRVKGELRLVSRDHVLSGGESGAIVDLDEPDASLLMKMLRYEDELHRMPPAGKLADEEIGVFRQWIADGLPWSDRIVIEVTEETEDSHEPSDGLEGWSYRPVVKPAVPEVRDAAWAVNEIDRFVLHELERAGLAPAPRATRQELIRRATWDLLGLPPSPEEVRAFLEDDAPDAWHKVVERLLASPHYGEKWARHWLDLVRYAETNGYERDTDKRLIWRYRDWVIDAFNQDLPYDRFVVHQLAGDELDEPTPASITATGYHRLMIWDDEPGNGREQARYDVLADNVATTSHAFLGMSLGCARCHDHKKDPLTQEDYYSFMAFFQGLTDHSVDHSFSEIMTREERAEYDAALRAADEELEQLGLAMREIEDELRRELAWQQAMLEVGGSADLLDLRYHFYRDSLRELPDFDMLLAEETGLLPAGHLTLEPATRDEDFGFVFRGDLVVPRTGTYAFELACRGGARLTLGDQVVIDHDGLHQPDERARGSTALTAGTVPFRLDLIHAAGAPELSLWWSEGARSEWRYRFDEPEDDWTRPDHDDTQWTVGEPGFGAPGTPAARVGTEWHGRDIWLRKRFEWRADAADELLFAGHHDDDVEVYVNGVLALERDGYVVDYDLYEPTPEGIAAVREGSNLLAVHCTQDFGGQYVHIEPVRRSHTDPAELAFGRRALHADSGGLQRVPAEELFAAHGSEALGLERSQEWYDLLRRREQVRAARPRPRLAMAAQEEESVRPMFVHVRGNAAVRGDEVRPRFPSPLADAPPRIRVRAESSGRRRALAEWIVSPDNPLTARVMANRIWQHHFGRGIVRSPNDFGELGERPTHPELLDWLASVFVEDGWSIKALHRRILHSSTWRSSSRVSNPDAELLDPTNDLFWRFELRRLTAEELRDGILVMTGRFNPKMGGAPFYEPMPHEVLETSSRPDDVWGVSPEEETFRRSVYIKVKRSLIAPLLASFDLADTDNTCAARFQTTQPTQALTLLNSEFSARHAEHFTARLMAETGPGDEERVERALWLAFQRAPSEDEVERHVEFLRRWREDFAIDERGALEVLCLAILNLNEFCYLD